MVAGVDTLPSFMGTFALIFCNHAVDYQNWAQFITALALFVCDFHAILLVSFLKCCLQQIGKGG